MSTLRSPEMRKRVQPAKNVSENRMRVLSLALVQALSAGAVASLATTAVHAQSAEKVEKIELTNFEGRRRQLQYVGKLMRGLEPATLQAARDALEEQRSGSAQQTLALHAAEQWRDDLIA